MENGGGGREEANKVSCPCRTFCSLRLWLVVKATNPTVAVLTHQCLCHCHETNSASLALNFVYNENVK